MAFLVGRTYVVLFDHFLYPIGPARYLYYLGMVDQPVDDRVGYDGITEDLAPLRQGLIGGDDEDGPLLVSGGDELEEQPAIVLRRLLSRR